jgi:hypothetical protein
MDTSGTGQQDATRGGIGTISRQSARSARGGRVRPESVPEPVPVPAVEPAERRTRQRQSASHGQQASQRLPESPPQPRNARPVPSADPAERRARRRRPEAVRAEAVAQPRNLMPVAPAPRRNARPVPPMPTGAPTPQTAPSKTAPSQAPPFESAQPAAPQPAPQSMPRSIRAAAGSHRMPFMLLLCGLLGGALVSALVISTTLAEGSFQITGLQNSTSALMKQRQVLQEEVAQAQSAQVIQSRALKLGMRPQGELRFLDLKTGKTSSDRGTGLENAINVPGYTP